MRCGTVRLLQLSPCRYIFPSPPVVLTVLPSLLPLRVVYIHHFCHRARLLWMSSGTLPVMVLEDELQHRSASIRSCPDFSHDTLVPAADAKSQRSCDDRKTRRDPHLGAEEGLSEKPACAADTAVWPPWRRADGWAGWGRESVSTMSLVPCLVVQAFSAGVLDATTYADFHTFASNRQSIPITVAVSADEQRLVTRSCSRCRR